MWVRRLAAAVIAVLPVFGGAAQVATADPEPWPTIRYYDRADIAPLTFPGVDGVWFQAPTGQNCGIWGPGSFACSGLIPGAPPGTQAVGWIGGDRAMHYDWSVRLRMPQTQAQSPLPPRTTVEHQGSLCAVTGDGQTYCERGPLRFLLAPEGTWLTPPWMDLPRR